MDSPVRLAARLVTSQLQKRMTKDFEQMYWHSPIPPAFMAIDSVVLNELFLANTGAAETQDDIR